MFIYLFIWLHQFLVVAHRSFVAACGIFIVARRIFSCSMWDLFSCGMRDLVPLVPWPGIELGPPALEVWSLNHWTTREVPKTVLLLTTEFAFSLRNYCKCTKCFYWKMLSWFQLRAVRKHFPIMPWGWGLNIFFPVSLAYQLLW